MKTAPEYINYLKSRIDELYDHVDQARATVTRTMMRIKAQESRFQPDKYLLDLYKRDLARAQDTASGFERLLTKHVKELNDCRLR